MNWKSIWAEFTDWYNENEQSEWEEQQQIIEEIVERHRKKIENKG